MSKIIEGVVIGITVGVILEFCRFLRMIYLRKKQIGHLRKIIKKAKQDIHGIGSLPPEISTPGQISTYQWLISELRIILKDRAFLYSAIHWRAPSFVYAPMLAPLFSGNPNTRLPASPICTFSFSRSLFAASSGKPFPMETMSFRDNPPAKIAPDRSLCLPSRSFMIASNGSYGGFRSLLEAPCSCALKRSASCSCASKR